MYTAVSHPHTLGIARVHILPSLFRCDTERRQRNTQARVAKHHSLDYSRTEKRQTGQEKVT